MGNGLVRGTEKSQHVKKNDVDNQLIQFVNLVMEELFGAEGAKLCKPLFLKNRTVTVTCMNSTIAQEIRLHQQEMVDKINLKLGKKEVDRIRYLT